MLWGQSQILFWLLGLFYLPQGILFKPDELCAQKNSKLDSESVQTTVESLKKWWNTQSRWFIDNEWILLELQITVVDGDMAMSVSPTEWLALLKMKEKYPYLLENQILYCIWKGLIYNLETKKLICTVCKILLSRWREICIILIIIITWTQ